MGRRTPPTTVGRSQPRKRAARPVAVSTCGTPTAPPSPRPVERRGDRRSPTRAPPPPRPPLPSPRRSVPRTARRDSGSAPSPTVRRIDATPLPFAAVARRAMTPVARTDPTTARSHPAALRGRVRRGRNPPPSLSPRPSGRSVPRPAGAISSHHAGTRRSRTRSHQPLVGQDFPALDSRSVTSVRYRTKKCGEPPPHFRAAFAACASQPTSSPLASQANAPPRGAIKEI